MMPVPYAMPPGRFRSDLKPRPSGQVPGPDREPESGSSSSCDRQSALQVLSVYAFFWATAAHELLEEARNGSCARSVDSCRRSAHGRWNSMNEPRKACEERAIVGACIHTKTTTQEPQQ